MNTPSLPKTEYAPRLRPTIWDGLIVLAVLALAGILLFSMLPENSSDDAVLCTISQNGETVDSFSLKGIDHAQRRTYGDFVVLIEDQQVCIEHAPCANQNCVHTGWIRSASQSIVCLPERFIVELSGSSKTQNPDFDIIVK